MKRVYGHLGTTASERPVQILQERTNLAVMCATHRPSSVGKSSSDLLSCLLRGRSSQTQQQAR